MLLHSKSIIHEVILLMNIYGNELLDKTNCTLFMSICEVVHPQLLPSSTTYTNTTKMYYQIVKCNWFLDGYLGLCIH